MTDIKFTANQHAQIADKLRIYLRDQFELDAGQFETGFLLDFISQEIAAVYYNRGLADAQAQLSRRVDNVLEAIDELVQPTSIDR